MLIFKTNTKVGEATHSRQIEINLCEWLSWSLLHANSFINITGDETTPSPEMSLKLTRVPGIADGRCWESRRSNWVWEGNLVDVDTPPISPQVYLNTSLVDPSLYRIDYPSGRVVFNTPLATNSVVSAKYSCRFHQVYDSNHPFSYKVDSLSLRPDDPRWETNTKEGGELEVLAKDRLQLPSFFVSPQGGFRHRAYEMGSTSNEVWEDFRILCLAETKPDLVWMKDVICEQVDCSPSTFNINSTSPALNQHGYLVGSPTTYEQRCTASPWKVITIEKIGTGDYNKAGFLYWIPIFLTIRTGVI